MNQTTTIKRPRPRTLSELFHHAHKVRLRGMGDMDDDDDSDDGTSDDSTDDGGSYSSEDGSDDTSSYADVDATTLGAEPYSYFDGSGTLDGGGTAIDPSLDDGSGTDSLSSFFDTSILGESTPATVPTSPGSRSSATPNRAPTPGGVTPGTTPNQPPPMSNTGAYIGLAGVALLAVVILKKKKKKTNPSRRRRRRA